MKKFEYDEVFVGWYLTIKRALENATSSKSDPTVNYIKTYKSE
jgi:hypothetical protein